MPLITRVSICKPSATKPASLSEIKNTINAAFHLPSLRVMRERLGNTSFYFYAGSIIEPRDISLTRLEYLFRLWGTKHDSPEKFPRQAIEEQLIGPLETYLLEKFAVIRASEIEVSIALIPAKEDCILTEAGGLLTVELLVGIIITHPAGYR